MEMALERTRYSLFTFIIALIWINVCVKQICCEPDTTTQMQKVKEKILKNYDKYIRPTNGTNTTEVHTAFMPRQIIEFNEDLAIFSVDSYLFMTWLDPRLQWNTTDYNGYLQLPASMIWVPDITVHNSHSQSVNPTQEVLVAFDQTGRVWWVPPILTQTSCSALTAASADKVECVIAVGSWMHDGWEIDFQHSEWLILDEFENINPRWELIESEARVFRNVTYYECCPEPYLSIQIFFPMRRRSVPAIDATRASCILVMLLTLSIFWLPPDSSKKVLLGGFLFFSLNVLLVYLGKDIQSPALASSAVSFVKTTMYLVVLAILVQVFIIIKIASLSGPSRPSPTIIHFLTGPLGKYTCLKIAIIRRQSITGSCATKRRCFHCRIFHCQRRVETCGGCS
ncbi:Neuronal acetylcholine receptor subunit like protein [Argiope bruennichi]|uniref:Neuronal acetylcholine receptor subunit like protein n=1 Tax=Argiope bruennichi TaxID=94029 RepID=A0A8T0EI73_ARGBR|nr:Neuronal acetylcholine receptor subunit like protein [Argiope bruennichi]